MIFRLVFLTGGLRLMHSPDLDDMRRALLEEDEDHDGPDGGAPHARPRLRRRRVGA